MHETTVPGMVEFTRTTDTMSGFLPLTIMRIFWKKLNPVDTLEERSFFSHFNTIILMETLRIIGEYIL